MAGQQPGAAQLRGGRPEGVEDPDGRRLPQHDRGDGLVTRSRGEVTPEPGEEQVRGELGAVLRKDGSDRFGPRALDVSRRIFVGMAEVPLEQLERARAAVHSGGDGRSHRPGQSGEGRERLEHAPEVGATHAVERDERPGRHVGPGIARRREDDAALGERLHNRPPTLDAGPPCTDPTRYDRGLVGGAGLERFHIIRVDDHPRTITAQREHGLAEAFSKVGMATAEFLDPTSPVGERVDLAVYLGLPAKLVDIGVLSEAEDQPILGTVGEDLTEQLTRKRRLSQAAEALQDEQALSCPVTPAYLVLPRAAADEAVHQHGQPADFDRLTPEPCGRPDAGPGGLRAGGERTIRTAQEYGEPSPAQRANVLFPRVLVHSCERRSRAPDGREERLAGGQRLIKPGLGGGADAVADRAEVSEHAAEAFAV